MYKTPIFLGFDNHLLVSQYDPKEAKHSLSGLPTSGEKIKILKYGKTSTGSVQKLPKSN